MTPSSLRTHGQSGLRCEIGKAPQEAVERLLTLQDLDLPGDPGCQCRPRHQFHSVRRQSPHWTQHRQDCHTSTQPLHQDIWMCRIFSEQQLRCWWRIDVNDHKEQLWTDPCHSCRSYCKDFGEPRCLPQWKSLQLPLVFRLWCSQLRALYRKMPAGRMRYEARRQT